MSDAQRRRANAKQSSAKSAAAREKIPKIDWDVQLARMREILDEHTRLLRADQRKRRTNDG